MRKALSFAALVTALCLLLSGCALRGPQTEAANEISLPQPQDEPENMILGESISGSLSEVALYHAASDFSSFSTVNQNLRAEVGQSLAEAAARVGILLALFFCAGLYVWLLLRREDMDDRVLLGVCILFCLGVPYLLTHMHDRYFFVADILTFALAVIVPALGLVPVLVSFGSFLGYYAYLRMRFLVPMRWGGAAMLAALLITAGYVVYRLNRPREKAPAVD